MSDFPKGGDIGATRTWLDRKGFDGIFVGWEADAILGLEKSDVLTVLPGENGLKLWGFLNTARQQAVPAPASTVISESVKKEIEDITKLRDAIRNGSVEEIENECINGDFIFPVEENAKEIFLRDFYPIFWQCFLDSVINDATCPGMVCRGPPGVGKSYMAMYFMFKLLREGYTVVYEQVLTDKVYVIPPIADCRLIHGQARSDAVPEFYRPKTVHLFDACAGVNNREPIKNPSKVIVFTSPNFNSYKQLQRLGAIMLTVPSYTREEMDKRRKSFPNLTDEEYQNKLEICGHGSIRLVLGLSMKRTEDLLNEAVKNTTVSNMIDIAQGKDVDVVNGIRGPSSLFSTSLAKGADKSNIRSYKPSAVGWNISSAYIMRKLLTSCQDEAMLFAARAAAVFQQTPGLEITAGRFFEALAPVWLAKGGEYKVRKLDGKLIEIKETWPKLTLVNATHIKQLSEALKTCTSPETMCLFLRDMVLIDACVPLTKYLQCTQATSHTLNLNALLTICKQLPSGSKLRLYFVVPDFRYDNGWKNAQSFVGPDCTQRNADKLEKMTDGDIQDKMKVTKADYKLVSGMLEQYVVGIDVDNPPATVKRMAYSFGSTRAFSTTARRDGSTVHVHGSVANLKVLSRNNGSAVRGSMVAGWKVLQSVLKMM